MTPNLKLDESVIHEFCRKWKVKELALFGSVLREDFQPDSDVDVLVTFAEDADWSLFDFVRMSDELKELLGREVDLVEKPALRNPFRRKSILENMEVVYAVD
jgi:predicted nucleotidyltransferase